MGFSSKPKIKRTQPSNVFGHIKGVPVGSTFENRLFLHHSSVHTGILAGISGSKNEGCYSVVMSGGYEDDKDEGYRFIYTGCGGRDRSDGEKPREGPQTCDQSWSNSRNASLRVSMYTQKPVRVVRGYKSSSDFAPAKGYRYDGLYVVEDAWKDVGKSGFQVCKVLLRRLPDQPPIPRRQGTLNLDLSEWERPRHFGTSTARTSPSSRSPSPEHTRTRLSSDRRTGTKGKERHFSDESDKDAARVHKDSGDKASIEDDLGPVAGPSGTQQPVRKQTSKPPVVAPIPLTTNVVSARTHRPAVAQAQLAAPQPDVQALLAEWGSTPAQSSRAGSSFSAGTTRK